MDTDEYESDGAENNGDEEDRGYPTSQCLKDLWGMLIPASLKANQMG